MNFNTVVSLPANVITHDDADFVRDSEGGAIPCYVNPTGAVGYQYLDPTQQLLGGVTAYSSNNPDGVELLLTDERSSLLPDNFFFKNGIVCLNVTSKGVEYYYWDQPTTDYIYLNTFNLGEITYLAPKVLNSNVAQIQINDTKWTLRRGKPFVYVQHPYTPVGYNLAGTYNHDNVITNFPSANADITMQSFYYGQISNSISNLVPVEIATGTDKTGDTTGFGPNTSGTITLSSSTDWCKNGTRSLKVVTDGSIIGQGYSASSAHWSPVTPGVTYTGCATVYGLTGSVYIYMPWYDASGTYISQANNITITLDGTPKTIMISGTAPKNAVKSKVSVLTSSPQAITYYVDEIIQVPGLGIPYFDYLNITTGELDYNTKQLIVKTAPTTIKSDSIPADPITIIGHSNKNAIGYDTADNIAQECFMQVLGYAKPYKVI